MQPRRLSRKPTNKIFPSFLVWSWTTNALPPEAKPPGGFSLYVYLQIVEKTPLSEKRNQWDGGGEEPPFLRWRGRGAELEEYAKIILAPPKKQGVRESSKGIPFLKRCEK